MTPWILPYFRRLYQGYIHMWLWKAVKGCERVLLKELFFLFVILKAFFGPVKASALDGNVYVWFDGFLHFTSFCSLLSYWVDSQFSTKENLLFRFHCNISFKYSRTAAAPDNKISLNTLTEINIGNLITRTL